MQNLDVMPSYTCLPSFFHSLSLIYFFQLSTFGLSSSAWRPPYVFLGSIYPEEQKLASCELTTYQSSSLVGDYIESKLYCEETTKRRYYKERELHREGTI